MSDTSNEDKTEQPTQRRLERARQEGSVARVQGLPGAVIMVTAAVFFLLAGRSMIGALERSVRAGLAPDTAAIRDPGQLFTASWHIIAAPLMATGTFAALLLVVGVLASVAIGGWVFSGQLLIPDPKRINPLTGLSRLFSREGLAEIVKALLKLVVIGGAAYGVLRGAAPALIDLAREPWIAAMSTVAGLATRAMLIFAASLAFLVVLEVPYQLWSHRGQLRMTRQELRDEMRELEVSAQTKRRLRTLRRRYARARMMTEVPRADVVITNPEHYAAALRYQDGTMRAPRLVAKGSGLIAQRIRELAAEHGVPMVAAPPLARAIYRFVDLEDEIPVALYQAVAEVLAYVYRLRLARDNGRPVPPMPDRQFEPPPEFRAD